MSDNDAGNPTPTAGEQQTVPLSALLEERRARQNAEAQAQAITRLLQQTAPQQTRPAAQESPTMRKMKEENPELYAELKSRDFQAKQQSAALFQANDTLDRVQFHQAFGKNAEKYAGQVEAMLNDLRAQGIHSYNRGAILKNIIADDTLKKEAQAVNTPAPVTTTSAPPSDPKAAAPLQTGSTGSSAKALSLEEREAALTDFEF